MLIYLEAQRQAAVNPEEVVSVLTIDGDSTQVHMRGGHVFHVPPDYGQSGWRTRDRIVREVNEACRKAREGE